MLTEYLQAQLAGTTKQKGGRQILTTGVVPVRPGADRERRKKPMGRAPGLPGG